MEVNDALGSLPEASKRVTGLANGASLVETFDNFLTLLTTQLENQDPLSPMDANQFTEQLVQFTEVEQSLSTNDKLDELISLQSGNQLTASLDYVGKTVTAASDHLVLQDGSATVSYEISELAETATLFILDAFGSPMQSIPLDPSLGRHEVTWDGLDQSGNALPDGVYGFAISAVDQNNGGVEVTQAARGKVTAVRLEDGRAILELGELDIFADEILGAGLLPEG